MRDVHCCLTVFYQQIENSNIANQIHGFTIDCGKFILIMDTKQSKLTATFCLVSLHETTSQL